jgi:hypothetical protein
VYLSRRDQMMVARHGMPGMCHPQARPVGYGMIGWREGAIVADGRQTVAPHITPFATGRTMSALYQAFHARTSASSVESLPSFRPFGTSPTHTLRTMNARRSLSPHPRTHLRRLRSNQSRHVPLRSRSTFGPAKANRAAWESQCLELSPATAANPSSRASA